MTKKDSSNYKEKNMDQKKLMDLLKERNNKLLEENNKLLR